MFVDSPESSSNQASLSFVSPHVKIALESEMSNLHIRNILKTAILVEKGDIEIAIVIRSIGESEWKLFRKYEVLRRKTDKNGVSTVILSDNHAQDEALEILDLALLIF